MHQHRTAFLLATLSAATVPAFAAAQSKDNAAPTRTIASWTADRRTYIVGDVITVVLDEATIASASETQSGADVQSRKNSMKIEPPKVGVTQLPSLNGDMATGKQSSSRQNGEASRRLAFRGNMTVRVVAVDAKTGLYQIKGEKTVDVDKNKQTMTFTGWIRPDDVSRANIVESDRVADAQLEYGLGGKIGKTRGGIIGRLLSAIWP